MGTPHGDVVGVVGSGAGAGVGVAAGVVDSDATSGLEGVCGGGTCGDEGAVFTSAEGLDTGSGVFSGVAGVNGVGVDGMIVPKIASPGSFFSSSFFSG